MIENKHMDIDFSVKNVNEDGFFSGYASVFDVIDSQKDVIIKGAFERTIENRVGEIKLLWQHQVNEPIGCFKVIKEDSHGLYVEGRLLLDIQKGQEAYSLLKSGAIKGLSIGYTVVEAYMGDSNIRIISDVDLWEISIVTFPANENANITFVKERLPETERQFEKFLRENGFSRKNAKTIVANGFKASTMDDDELLELDWSMQKAIMALT